MPAVSKSIRSSALPSSTWSLALKSNDAGRADLAQLAAIVFGQADRGVGMRQVGNPPQSLGHLGLEPAEPLFFVGDRRLQAFALVDQGSPLLGIALAAGGLGDLVLAAADLFDGLKQAPALAFELDHAIDVIDARRAGRCDCGSFA